MVWLGMKNLFIKIMIILSGAIITLSHSIILYCKVVAGRDLFKSS